MAKLPRVAAFYKGQMGRAAAQEFLKSGSINYVLLSQYERALGGSVATLDGYGLLPLQAMGRGDTAVTLYKVNPLPQNSSS